MRDGDGVRGQCRAHAARLRVLREGLDAGPAVDGAAPHDQHHGRGAPLADARVLERDRLVARGAHEAPLRVAAAAVLVGPEEAVGELQEAAEPAVEAGALADADDARELLDGADEDEDGGGEVVLAVPEDGVDGLGEAPEDRVVDFELRGAIS